MAQWLVRRTRDLKVESSSPGRCTHGKTLNSHSASLHSILQLTGIQGEWDTTSRFILQKPEISAGLMGLLARPVSIGVRLSILIKGRVECRLSDKLIYIGEAY